MNIIDLDVHRELSRPDESIAISRFNGTGSRTPLLFVRSWFGELKAYQLLAQALGPDQPLLTLAPPQGASRTDYPATVTQWARWACGHLGDLSGPCIIGGFSFGGVIALHITREIQRTDICFRRVVLIDTSLPRKTHDAHRSFTRRTLKQLLAILEVERGGRLAYIQRKHAQRKHRRMVRASRPKSDLNGSDDVMTSTGKRMPLLQRAIWVCYLKYQPQLWQIPVLLFWTEQSRSKVEDAGLGWTRWMRGPVEIRGLPGTHLSTMNDANIPALAERLATI